MTRLSLYLLLSAAASLAFAVHARAPAQGTVVIYRCTDASGALTVQNGTRCPKGSKEERRVIESAPPSTTYVPDYAAPRAPRTAVAPAAPTPPPVATADTLPKALPAADRLPPPPLFQCNTFDNDSYLSDSADAQPRCVRLTTTGMDGNAAMGAGQACQMVTDQCQRVPDGAACDAWKKRTREAEAAWKFARREQADANRIEYERIARILNESTCGR